MGEKQQYCNLDSTVSNVYSVYCLSRVYMSQSQAVTERLIPAHEHYYRKRKQNPALICQRNGGKHQRD